MEENIYEEMETVSPEESREGRGRSRPDPTYIRYLFFQTTLHTCSFMVGNPVIGPTEHIGACKFTMMAHSEAFRGILGESNLAERSPITITDIQPKTFRYMLRCMYGYNIVPRLIMQEALDLLYVADKYMIHHLKESLAIHIASLTTADNVIIIMNRTECIQHETLKDVICRIIQCHTSDLLYDQNFFELESSGLLLILQQDSLNVSEKELWLATIKWAAHHAQTKDGSVLRELLSEHMQYIRLCSLSLEDLIQDVSLTYIITVEELFMIFKCFNTKTKQEDLTTICNEVNARNLVVTTPIYPRRNWESAPLLWSNMIIRAKRNPLELMSVFFSSNNKGNEDGSNKYKCEIFIVISESLSRKPHIFNLHVSKEVECGKSIEVHFNNGKNNIELKPDVVYVIQIAFLHEHNCIYSSEKRDKEVIDNKDVTLALGGIPQKLPDIFETIDPCGSHITQISYKIIK